MGYQEVHQKVNENTSEGRKSSFKEQPLVASLDDEVGHVFSCASTNPPLRTL